MSSSIQVILNEIENLGKTGATEVSIGGFSITLSPLSSAEEIEVYSIVEEEFLLPADSSSPNSPTLRMGPAYVMRVKEELVARAITKINGIAVVGTDVVKDSSDTLTEVSKYLRNIVRGWSPEIINFLHIRYNQMLVEVANSLGYEMPHKTFVAMLEKVLQSQVMAAKSLENSLEDGEDFKDDADVNSNTKEIMDGTPNEGERPV